MSIEKDLDMRFDLNKSFEVQAEYTCPACHNRRRIVFRNARSGAEYPCSCGGFTFVLRDNAFREVTKLLTDFQKSLGSLGKRR